MTSHTPSPPPTARAHRLGQRTFAAWSRARRLAMPAALAAVISGCSHGPAPTASSPIAVLSCVR